MTPVADADFPRTRRTARSQIAGWLRLPELVRAFENLQSDVLELFARTFGDAPTDGQTYGRKGGAWAPAGGVEEAPDDGTTYGRNSGAWAAVANPGGAVDDLAPPVAPFIPTDDEALRTETAELHATVAVLRQQLHDLQQGPTP